MNAQKCLALRVSFASVIALGGSAFATPEKIAHNSTVVPRIAQSAPPISLGALVYKALPQHGLKWDALQVPEVRWVTNGIAMTSTGWSYREGWARVRVGGAMSQLLRRNWNELAWRVELGSNKIEKWGPQTLTLQPGGEGDLSCFGVEAKGCTFPTSAISDPRIIVKHICDAGTGSNHYHVFEVRARDGRAATVSHVTSAGSGGSADLLEIRTVPAKAVCAEVDRDYPPSGPTE